MSDQGIHGAFASHESLDAKLAPALEDIGIGRGLRTDSLPVNAYTAGDTSGEVDEGLPERTEATLPHRASRQFYPSSKSEVSNYVPGGGPAYDLGPAAEGGFTYPAKERPSSGQELASSRSTPEDAAFKKAEEIGAPPGANRLLEHLGKAQGGRTTGTKGVQENRLAEPPAQSPEAAPVPVVVPGPAAKRDEVAAIVPPVPVTAPGIKGSKGSGNKGASGTQGPGDSPTQTHKKKLN